jgi:predicted ATPase/DNA-binding XRE family transcriptional regulator
MKTRAPGSFGAQLKKLREAAGFTQEELATIAGLSVHAISAIERGERRRPHVDTVRALSSALDLTGATRDAFVGSSRAAAETPAHIAAVDEFSGAHLPVAPTMLLGRESDLQTLRHWLADRRARLVTLTGPGGSGKTRLATELAHGIAAEAETRVVFVPLAAIRNPAFVASEIAEALGLSDVTALDLPRRARLACADRPTLLVLDNFEQILDAAPLVAELLSSVASLRVLATSRAPLRLRGEREYAVGPLALQEDSSIISPEDVERSPALRLFVERVQDVQPYFRLTRSNGSVLTSICRQLDALPLALELAAPWLKSLTPEDLLRRLDEDVLMSAAAGGPRDLPERQQTMNATVAWSYQLLEPDEQRVFRRLGALPGRFPIEAAAAVLTERDDPSSGIDRALATVAGLIDKSLLLRVGASIPTRPLYQMLETVRAYAALKLSAADDRDDALEGLVRYCLGEASLAADGLLGPAQLEWLHRVRDDLESYRATLAWLIERGRGAEAADIAWKLLYFFVIRGHAAEGLRWYGQILELPSLPASAECRALAGSGAMLFTQGAYEGVRTAVTRAFARAQACGDVKIASYAELLLGHVEYGVGNGATARECFAASLRGFRAASTPWGIANAVMGMAAVALASGDTEETERLLDEADAMLQSVGPWFSSLAAYVRAILALRRGSPDEAIVHVHGSLIKMRELHDNFAFVYALIPLAAAAVLKGEDTWAARILGVRDAVTQRTGAAAIDKSVNDLRDQSEREVRVRLGADRWNRAYAAGRRMSIDSLLTDIQNVLNTVHV